VRNLTIKRKALYQPTLKARHERENRKPIAIYHAESLIPPRLEGTFADAEEYAKKVIDTHGLLQEFYGRKRILRLDHSLTWPPTHF
jgi:hypothetical protein